MSELVIVELQKRINKLIDRKYELEEKIDTKLDTVDGDETKLGTHKASVTRWRNMIEKLKTDIDKCQTEITTKEEVLRELKVESTGHQVVAQSWGGKSPLLKELKTLQHDFSTHPRFSPKLDIAVFTRHMQVLYDTHVSNCKGLEEVFVKLVECHIDTSYRVQLQRHVELEGRFTTWAEMKAYLLETHRSCSTLFQELAKFTNIPMKHHESVREYCQRVKTAGEEAETIIRSKLKDELKAEPTTRDIFELMQMDAVVRQMQAHPRYRDDYNLIVNQIDSCTNIDMLSHKASKIADRKVHIDVLSEPSTYTNTDTGARPNRVDMMEQRMDKLMTLIAQGQNEETKPSETNEKNTTKGKMSQNWKRPKHWDDPNWRSKHAHDRCRLYDREGTCTRTDCPFSPCNGSGVFYTKDF